MRRFLLWGVVGLICGSVGVAAHAQTNGWVDAVMPERTFDFGTVARGSQLRHTFQIVNQTDQVLRIVNWATKCGCTNVKVGAKEIPPGTRTSVEATVDTTRFQGPKASGLTLTFDRPSPVTVDLNLNCFIRTDITMNPGQIDFGIVRRSGKMPSATLTMTYAGGQPDWEVTRMRTQSNRVKAELRELSRNGTQINYILSADLQPNVENGYFKDEITLVTNDPNSPTIPVSVVANIQSAVSVSPAIINFGEVRPGQEVSKTILVRSSQPFAITKLTPSLADLQLNDAESSAKPLHTVKLTFKAPNETGPHHGTISIDTDLPDEPSSVVKTFATVIP